ncbi:MAG: hypothetical protein M3M95_07070, partial [Pseudomonadota bacterium]|nr:hypothetical protein [Pseudomonadota bacterium]
MTSSAEEVANLTRWAAGLGRDDQDRLLLALANLLSSARLGARSRELFDSLLPALGAYADAAARRELALRLSDAPWAP